MHEFERYSRTSEVLKRIDIVFSFWIQDEDSLRDRLWNRMMIRHDDIDPETFCMSDRLDISCPAVHSDDECDSFFREFIEKIRLQSVSIMDTMRESITHLALDFCEKSDQDRCTRNPVDIIISKDHDAFSFFSRDQDPLYCRFHIDHQEWIVEV